MQEEQVLSESPQAKWKRYAALFITSQGITLFGSSVVQMAIIWQVALETSSGLWVTLLTLSSTIPQVILSLFGGVWADKYPRKRLIILADAWIALVTLALALVFMIGAAENILPLIIGISALRSVGAGIQTPAVNATIPQIVPEKHLMRYNGINSSMMSIVQFAAPAAAGAILYLAPFYTVLLIDVATAVIGISILALVIIRPVTTTNSEPGESFFAELASGIRYAAHEKSIRRLLLTFGAFIFLSVPSGFLAVLMIERTFGDSYFYLTINEMAGFAGMVLGGILLGTWGGFTKRYKTLVLGLIGYSVFSFAIGFTGVFWLFATFMFLLCFCIPLVQSSTTTMLQEQVPPEKMGRVFGLFGIMYSGFMPLGMVLFGPLADVVRIQTMIIVCGIVLLLLGVCVIAWNRKNR